MIMPWPRSACMPMHGICVRTAQHRSACQSQSPSMTLLNQYACDPWLGLLLLTKNWVYYLLLMKALSLG